MKEERINFKEFSVFKEVPVIIKIRAKHVIKKKIANRAGRKKHTGNGIIIVNTCIIGDFLATLPAMNKFLEVNKSTADIVVAPPLKTLAEKIRSIDNVFLAQSSYSRSIEKKKIKDKKAEDKIDYNKEYKLLLVFRASPDSYNIIKNIKYSKLISYDKTFIKFFGHLVWNISRKKSVKQWRDVNYEIVNMKTPKNHADFNQIFYFTKKDYDNIKKLPEMNGVNKKIIIHTGSGWSAKLWEDARWIEVLKKVNALGNFKFIFVGGGETEEKSFNKIQKKLDFKIFSLIKKVDLKDLLLVMRKSDYFIGIDSGPRNLAHLADLRSVIILGSGIKDFMPPSNKDIVIDNSGPRSTSLFYFGENAMKKTTADEVFQAFKKLLKNHDSKNR